MTWCVKKIVVRLRLFDRRFLAVLQFAYCVRRNRFLVSIVVQQLFSCRSQRGEFCEPPRGGASARTAEAGLYFYKPQPPEHLFLPPFRVAASCIFQSAAEFSNNVQVMGISRSLALCPGPARIEDATPAAGPGEHLNEFPTRNDSMQGQYCHSEEIGRSTKNLYKSIRRQILDCTSFVFLLLARHSPQAAFGSQGKRFFTSFRMTK